MHFEINKKRDQHGKSSSAGLDCVLYTSVLLHETRPSMLCLLIHRSMKSRHQEMSPSPFLNLPPELRLTIYRHLLIKKIQPVRPKNLTENNRTSSPFTAILFTNRAIYLEAYPTLLSENTFEFQMCHRDYN